MDMEQRLVDADKKKWSIDQWVDLLKEAYDHGLIDEIDVYSDELIPATQMDGPTIMRTPSRFWHFADKLWKKLPVDRPIMIIPNEWAAWTSEERDAIQIRLSEKIPFGEWGPLTALEIRAKREERFFGQPGPEGR